MNNDNGQNQRKELILIASLDYLGVSVDVLACILAGTWTSAPDAFATSAAVLNNKTGHILKNNMAANRAGKKRIVVRNKC